MLKKVLYYIFLIFVKIISVLPSSIRRGFFFLLSRISYTFAAKTNKIIKANLEFIFEDKISPLEIKSIQKYSYYNILLWFQTQIENLNQDEQKVKENVIIENREIFDNLIKNNKKVILISAHFGNIEMLSYSLNKFVTHIVQVARESNFKDIDNFITKSRESVGAKIVYKEGALRHLVKALMKNKVVSLIVDQSINFTQGVEVEFLGKTVNQTSSPAMLARKFDAYIVPVAIFNKGKDKYTIKFYDSIAPIKTEDEKADILKSTQLQANAITKIILEDKKQWFWPHKRFKNHNKEIYE